MLQFSSISSQLVAAGILQGWGAWGRDGCDGGDGLAAYTDLAIRPSRRRSSTAELKLSAADTSEGDRLTDEVHGTHNRTLKLDI